MLVAVDGSAGSARAVTVAFEIAEMTGSKLFFVHVVPTPAISHFSMMSDSDPREVLNHYLANGQKLLQGYERAAKERGLEVELILEKGHPPERIVRAAQERQVDLIVIGSKGAVSGRKRGVGSTVEHVVLSSECPVVVTK